MGLFFWWWLLLFLLFIFMIHARTYAKKETIVIIIIMMEKQVELKIKKFGLNEKNKKKSCNLYIERKEQRGTKDRISLRYPYVNTYVI